MTTDKKSLTAAAAAAASSALRKLRRLQIIAFHSHTIAFDISLSAAGRDSFVTGAQSKYLELRRGFELA